VLSNRVVTRIQGVGSPLAQLLFGNGEDGFLFADWSELDELYQSALNGSTLVSADNDSVGLALNDAKWRGQTKAAIAAAASELANVGTQTLGAATGSASSGGWNITATSNFASVTQPGICTAGDAFLVDVEWSGNDEARNVSLVAGSGADIAISTAASGTATRLVWCSAAGSGGLSLYLSGSTLGDTCFLKITSIRQLPGKHAGNITGSQRPVWRANSGKPYLSFDNSDDRLPINILPGANGTIAAAFRAGQATDVILGGGATTGGKRAFLCVDSGGGMAYGLGDQNTQGGSTSSILDADHVAVLTWQGLAGQLYLDGALFASITMGSGPDGTGGGLTLGAYNNNGTFGSFLSGRIYAALALNRRVTAAEIARITPDFQRTYQ